MAGGLIPTPPLEVDMNDTALLHSFSEVKQATNMVQLKPRKGKHGESRNFSTNWGKSENLRTLISEKSKLTTQIDIFEPDLSQRPVKSAQSHCVISNPQVSADFLDNDAQGTTPPICLYNGIIDFWNRTSHNDKMDIDIFNSIDCIAIPVGVQKNNVGLDLSVKYAISSKRKWVEFEAISPYHFVDHGYSKRKKQRIAEHHRIVLDYKPQSFRSKRGRDSCLDTIEYAFEVNKRSCIREDLDNEEEDEFFDTNQSECSEWDYQDSEFEDSYGDSFVVEDKITPVTSPDMPNRSNGLDIEEEIKLKDEMESANGNLAHGFHILHINSDYSDWDNQDLAFEDAIDDSVCNDWDRHDSNFKYAIGDPDFSEEWETRASTVDLIEDSQERTENFKQFSFRIHDAHQTAQQLHDIEVMAINLHKIGATEWFFPFDPGLEWQLESMEIAIVRGIPFDPGLDWNSKKASEMRDVTRRQGGWRVLLFCYSFKLDVATQHHFSKFGNLYTNQSNEIINFVEDCACALCHSNCLNKLLVVIFILSKIFTKTFAFSRLMIDTLKKCWISLDTDHEIYTLVCSCHLRLFIRLLPLFFENHSNFIMQLNNAYAQADITQELTIFVSTLRSIWVRRRLQAFEDDNFISCNRLSLLYVMFNVYFSISPSVGALVALMAFLKL